jgi:uncharacterized GH25 family protein
MLSIMALKFLCALLAAATSALYAQVIEGTVSTSLGGAPIDGASVTIEQGGKTAYQATTDAAGAFRIEGVKDGSYTARFSKRGFQAPVRDAAARHPFRVVAGGDPVRLRVQMAPLGKVSGRVLDGDGHPVAGAKIELLFANSFAGNTDTAKEDGSFAFTNVEPGSYHLNARPRGKIKPPAPVGDQVRGWARTYYPGALDKAGAARIVVRPGADLPGQDIRLVAVPMHTVRGRVLDPKGDAVAKITVKLAAADEIQPEEQQAVSDDDGRFEFRGVYDGSWRLFAETETGGVKLHAFGGLEMLGHDLDGQDLRLRPPFTIRGRVEVETPGGFQGKRPLVIVVLFPAGGGPGYGQGNTDENGTFKIDGVFEGLYGLRAIGEDSIRNYYMASVMLGEREVLGQNVELAAGSLPLRIVYRSNGGTVRGAVEDCAGAGVVLMPQDPGLRQMEFIRRATCNEGGRYEIPQVRPGDYYAFAFDQAPVTLDALLRFTQALVNQAVKVTVRPGEGVSADLKVSAVN